MLNIRSNSHAQVTQVEISWYDSLLFCNWLSLYEGRNPYHERTGTKEKDSKNAEYDAWRVIPGANGYRLLNETEWVYACQAGSQTEFSTGNDETLLVKYCQMSSKLAAELLRQGSAGASPSRNCKHMQALKLDDLLASGI